MMRETCGRERIGDFSISFQRLEQDVAEVKRSRASIDDIKYAVDQIITTNAFEKHSIILQWVSLIKSEDDHSMAKSGLVNGTGNWIFHDTRYINWDISDAAGTLWIQGIGNPVPHTVSLGY